MEIIAGTPRRHSGSLSSFLIKEAPAPGIGASTAGNAWTPSAVFKGGQQTPHRGGIPNQHQHTTPPPPSSTGDSSSSLHSRSSTASISSGWSSPSPWTPTSSTTTRQRRSHSHSQEGAAQTAARSEARHQSLQQLRRQHSATTSSVVSVASLLQQGHAHAANSSGSLAVSRQSSFNMASPQLCRPSSAHSSRHPDSIVSSGIHTPISSNSSSGHLYTGGSRPQTAALRVESGTQTCGLSASLSAGSGALTSAASAAVLSDGGEQRMFQQMSRSGLIKTPARPGGAQPSSARQVESAASAALSAMRASVAASARELLTALAAGTSSEQLVRLGMLEPGLAWGGYPGTSGNYLGTGTGRPATSDLVPLDALSPANTSRFVGTPHVHIGQDLGGWTPMESQPVHNSGMVMAGCALTAVERDQLAEGRLQRCCAWVVNKTPEACCVCLDVMHLDESIVMTMCGHRFHRPCLKAHIVSGYSSSLQCPICRAAFVQQQQQQQPQQVQQVA